MTTSMRFIFKRTPVSLWADHVLTINGCLRLAAPSMTAVLGPNGSGKTMLLRTISTLLGSDASPVKSIDRSRVFVDPLPHQIRVGYLHQNPLDNFDGGPIGDNIRLAISQSHLDFDQQSAFIKRILVGTLDFHPSILSRPTRSLSHGEAQVLAVIMHIAMKPDIFIMDEAFGRLSRRNVRKIIDLLTSHGAPIHKLASFHADQFSEPVAAYCGGRYALSRSADTIQITDGPVSVPTSTQANYAEAAMFLDREALDGSRAHTDDFTNLPTESVMFIPGSGRPVSTGSVSLSVSDGGTQVTQCEIDIREGLNLIVGDNGSGKTLVAQVLGGDIQSISLFSNLVFGSSLRYKASPPLLFRCEVGQFSLPRLRRKARSFFLSSDPEQLIGAETVEEELETTPYPTDLDVPRILSEAQIGAGALIRQLSFGQRKLITFLCVPEQLDLAILDEPFANMSSEIGCILAACIRRRLDEKRWLSAVITSNRPPDTLAMLFPGERPRDGEAA